VGTYCKVVGCAANGGVCTPKPTSSPTAFVAQCGCDNVTYWNETVAGSFGANVKAAGVCPAGTAAPCKTSAGGTSCAEGRDCNVDVAQCGVPVSTAGVCWGLPKACPTNGAAAAASYRSCPGAGGGGCQSYCEAVRKENAFSRDAIMCP